MFCSRCGMLQQKLVFAPVVSLFALLVWKSNLLEIFPFVVKQASPNFFALVRITERTEDCRPDTHFSRYNTMKYIQIT